MNPFGRRLTREELTGHLPGVWGIIAGLETLDRKTLEGSELKVISRCGSGVSNVDLKAAEDLGIKVFSTPSAPTDAVAELTVGGVISLIRHMARMDSDLHNGRWSKRIGIQLGGSKVAIIGFGRIGRKVAKLLRAFGAEIVAVDPACDGVVDKVKIVSMEEALSQADVVTMHASGDDVILGRREFDIMKNGIFLLNCARGGVVDEKELTLALDNGKVAGAWLDCFREEPYHGPLVKYPQVMLTPHIGSYTSKCRSRMEMEAADNIIKFFEAAI
jgi:D-3-phosphoglycerate dehydrogenase